jgi:hypothetical protein
MDVYFAFLRCDYDIYKVHTCLKIDFESWIEFFFVISKFGF